MLKKYFQDGLAVVWVIAVVAIVVALGAAGLFYYNSKLKTSQQPPASLAPQRTRDTSSPWLVLNDQNNLGLDARYSLIAVGSQSGISSQTKVVLSVNNPSSSAMPAHLHSGSCAELGAVKHPLANVVNGGSDTMLELSLFQLKFELPMAINIHKSTTEPQVYVACADLNSGGSIDALLRK